MPAHEPFDAVLIRKAGLGPIYDKAVAEERLSRDDGLELLQTRNLPALGALANIVRRRKNADRAYFNRNLHINYTNICSKRCRFCAFHRLPNAEGAYVMHEADLLARLEQWRQATITELHMVGGIHPQLPFAYYLDLLRTVKRARPGVHLKAFTMVELAHLIELSGLGARQTIVALQEAGLDSCPGGGCEVLSDRLHHELFGRKPTPQQWLDLQRLVHSCGLKSNATLLYGHLETAEERVDHLVRLRELQDETGGFQAFVPLAFHPANTQLAHLPPTTGFDDLRTIALARLMLDNFAHIKAFWVMISPSLAQVSLSFGADDMDGTVLEERICHAAGAPTPKGLTLEQLLALIRESGHVAVERDTLYNTIEVHA